MLGEPGGRYYGDLFDVGGVAELVGPRDADRVFALVEVEAFEVPERGGCVGDRPRRARQHRHGVPELGQLPREMAAVHALTTAVRIAAIDEKRDPERVAGLGRARARKGRSGGRHEAPRMEAGGPQRETP